MCLRHRGGLHRETEEPKGAEDPYELTDLAGCPDHAEVQARLSAELDRWMQSQGDPGAALDTRKAYEAARRGEHIYVAPEGP